MSLWDTVKDTVGKAAPLLGTALGGPAGGAVAGLVADALGVENKPDAIQKAMESDPQAAIKLKRLQNEHRRELQRMSLEAETARLTEINKTMRAETQTDDAYVRRWRPTFGYAVCLTWVCQGLGLTYAIIAQPENAGDIIKAVGSLGMMWSVALGILGVNVSARSRDKRVRSGQDGRGVFEKLADQIGGRDG